MPPAEGAKQRKRNKAASKSLEASDTQTSDAETSDAQPPDARTSHANTSGGKNQSRKNNSKKTPCPKRRRTRRSHFETVLNQEGQSREATPESDVTTPSRAADDDDDEFPTLKSLTPSQDRKQFEKHEVVWIKYEKVYWPCLITAVHSSYVRYKFVNESRKKHISYRARFPHIKRFDDPEQNAILLREGKEKDPKIVDAYNRVVQYYCHLATQKELSALKFLTYDKVGDLLYGIVPETDSAPEDTEDEHSEVASNLGEAHSDSENHSSAEDEETSSLVDDSYRNDYDLVNDKDYQDLLEQCNSLLAFIESEDCFKHLENICNKSERMDLLIQNEELQLMLKSGYGPFSSVKSTDLTDKLVETIEKHQEKLKISQPCLQNIDYSLLQRLVIIPEAIIFALQKHFNLDRDKAEQSYEQSSMQLDYKKKPQQQQKC